MQKSEMSTNNSRQRQGLGMWRYSVLRQPGTGADQRYEDENIFYSLALFVRLICRRAAIYRRGYIR